ncbi:hypothetical protein C2W62_36525 [Candidatus Entotheonella serta]|nr:hypothetical protein C2W62_36525 [Candidatus Entotheonella serta]
MAVWQAVIHHSEAGSPPFAELLRTFEMVQGALQLLALEGEDPTLTPARYIYDINISEIMTDGFFIWKACM